MSAFLQVSDFQGATKLEPVFSKFAHIAAGIEINNFVATPTGWRDLADIQVGDEVLTFDNGAQRVMEIEHSFHGSETYLEQPAQWPLMVPAGAIGNSHEIVLAPNQLVMIENDASEALLGDPFMVVRADDLIGWNNIHRYIPDAMLHLVRLRFAQEQVIFGSKEMLYHCDAVDESGCAPLDVHYVPLASRQTAFLLEHTSSQQHARATDVPTHLAASECTVIEAGYRLVA